MLNFANSSTPLFLYVLVHCGSTPPQAYVSFHIPPLSIKVCEWNFMNVHEMHRSMSILTSTLVHVATRKKEGSCSQPFLNNAVSVLLKITYFGCPRTCSQAKQRTKLGNDLTKSTKNQRRGKQNDTNVCIRRHCK